MEDFVYDIEAVTNLQITPQLLQQLPYVHPSKRMELILMDVSDSLKAIRYVYGADAYNETLRKLRHLANHHAVQK